jgi:predicted DNA-binding transcriptional regulator AlpA
MTLPYPPPWQDKATLCEHLCLGDTTVDDWVKRGVLPPPRKRGGKLMWKWMEVDQWLDRGGATAQDSEISAEERIRLATERRNQHAH